MSSPTSQVRIGISGWRYKGWRGIFYPPDLAQRRELEFASRQFNSIELNGSFYSLQRPANFAQWADGTPDDFVFAIKGSRYITHMLKLRNVEAPLANFFAQGLLRLGAKLGPILWQLPPTLKFEIDRLGAFFSQLPKTQKDAAKLGRMHDERLDNRTWLRVPTDAPLRHTIEIRHESFACKEFIDLLRQHRVGLVVADTVEWPLLMDVTTDFVYCRLHGSEELYASGYDDRALDVWAQRVAIWAKGGEVHDGRRVTHRDASRRKRDVFVYFDNDAKVRAPFDAKKLSDRIVKLLEK
ncbi:MAG: DUF72 domain-containing protein [Acidobacteriota bacterium]|nr:DUF72 domain-containing protein [Acidobacteriota bacterium]